MADPGGDAAGAQILSPQTVVMVVSRETGLVARVGVPWTTAGDVEVAPERLETVYMVPQTAARPRKPDDGECCVCMEERADVKWWDYPCGHSICHPCAIKWSGGCPKCRKDMDGDYRTGRHIDVLQVEVQAGSSLCVVASPVVPGHLAAIPIETEIVLDVETGWTATIYQPTHVPGLLASVLEAYMAQHLQIHTNVLSVLSVPHHKCAECRLFAQLRCSGCKRVQYCSRSCQKRHWKTHKPECGLKE